MKDRDEQIIIELLLSYVKSVVPKGDRVRLDPEPHYDYAWEQYHLWYFQPNNHFEMAGWFVIRGKTLELTEITKMPYNVFTEDFKDHTFDMASPDNKPILKLLRKMFARVRKHLTAEVAARGKV